MEECKGSESFLRNGGILNIYITDHDGKPDAIMVDILMLMTMLLSKVKDEEYKAHLIELAEESIKGIKNKDISI